ncbi:DUF5050 domain-containing protein [Evansella sp. AB-P1]|uniref:DUF5050 domain-containing protein n=1 Tax=Evansella sp. AB-P1 TaxID=3037653 RepID=UPI00241F061F|nr:DUF5050 domain-containing protein [Evansella sp. AB-P1]MDG5790033.1 DUF5050 domain-containing protein [Evansella sp. AB-P1]
MKQWFIKTCSPIILVVSAVFLLSACSELLEGIVSEVLNQATEQTNDEETEHETNEGSDHSTSNNDSNSNGNDNDVNNEANDSQTNGNTNNEVIGENDSNNDDGVTNDNEVYTEGAGNSSNNVRVGGKYHIVDDEIFFANHKENNHLYKMNDDGSNSSQLTNHSVRDIHVIGDWVYYIELAGPYEEKSLNKIKIDGTDSEVIINEPVLDLHYYQGELLFVMENEEMQAPHIHRLSLDNDNLEILPYATSGFSMSGDNIVFYSLDGYNLGDIHGNDVQHMSDEGYGEFIFEGTDLYFTRGDGGTGLFRFSTDDWQLTNVIEDRIDYFNVDENSIYFSTAASEAQRNVYKSDRDGNNVEPINSVIYSIHVFDSILFGEFMRQGYVSYYMIEKATFNSKEIVPD